MSETVIHERVAALLSSLPNPKFNKKNSHFGNAYADLEGILDTVKPTIDKAGFHIHQTVTEQGRFATSLVDSATGTVVRGVATPFVLQAQSPQAAGSALTYFRRYGVLLLLNLVGEDDDDAERGEGRGQKKAPAKKTPAKKKPAAKKPAATKPKAAPKPAPADDDGDDW